MVTKRECCGFKIQISEDGLIVELPNGDLKKYGNARAGIISFSGIVESYLEKELFAIAEGYGYGRYTGERTEEVRK